MQFTNDSVRYAGITRLIEIAVELADIRNLKKPEAVAKIKQGFKIYACLQALEYSQFLSLEQRQRIWYCLIEVGEITDFPISPALSQIEQPAILIGGNTTIINNNTYNSGVPFDYQNLTVSTQTVDSFAGSAGLGCVWYYNIFDGTSAGRGGQIQAFWREDLTSVEYTDEGTLEIDGPITVELFVDINSGNVRLRATSTSDSINGDTWSITGIRLVY